MSGLGSPLFFCFWGFLLLGSPGPVWTRLTPAPTGAPPFGSLGGAGSVLSSGLLFDVCLTLAAGAFLFGGGSARPPPAHTVKEAVGSSDLSSGTGLAGQSGYASGHGDPEDCMYGMGVGFCSHVNPKATDATTTGVCIGHTRKSYTLSDDFGYFTVLHREGGDLSLAGSLAGLEPALGGPFRDPVGFAPAGDTPRQPVYI